MMTESMVVDVSQDWAMACDLQERFMEVPQAKTQRLGYSARCRQMRALGGDCFTCLPLPGDPDDAAAVNRQLYACSPPDRYATLFYGVFDENTRTLHYVNAGHNPALVIRGPSAITRP